MNTKVDCISCTNSNCIIKQNAMGEEAAPFLEKKLSLKAKKGQPFILEGAPVHGLYFVQQGKVKVGKTGINGKEQIVRLCHDGEIIGHRGFGVGQFYHISAVAIEDVVLCNFSTDTIMEMLKKVPSLCYAMMLFYADELNRSENKVKKIAQMTVREKVIDAILYINRKFGQTKNLLNIQLSRKEIADFAGTTDEQVIRVISSLKKEKILIAEGKKIGIINLEKLKREIAEHNFFLDS
ncbi:Crp/Fnr family transcriptional regulator [Flammeovirga yaeyamensis]|uniref:Crp/Fnr family transcriptional regulator n=1 Tax=Flammeovirga yaeyamensis TaxID=367791 RepID=A0AAX1N626_9BACT|nr:MULTISPECIES: Crp/Fnr family transcriptional regulator [Flammeovirga]ANQ49535.2 Crp/Fnr family transcriptional regulator [Flammeovirga sp. MY04]MBB3697560.1 CRP-like cAMP-binding protein [Flammeovirga yaeyamensis]NMF36254.1 Crp/Fnr family transcriptional regulator [Flammeovirga yaeyamensis]QWG02983.1 Crp/Fnr family transcriptional regulator [Flammeovirga yaeyamensis]